MLRSDPARQGKVFARRRAERPQHDVVARAVGPVFEALETRQLLAATLLKDIEPSTVGSNPQSLVSAGGLGYFVASETTATSTFYSVYRTDTTEAGTSAVWTTSFQPKNLTATSSGLAYFEAPVNGVPQVWRTDGTVAGTFAVTSFTAAQQTFTYKFTDVNGTLYFVVGDPFGTAELWKSGGTAGTTSRVVQLGWVSDLTPVGGTLFFTGAPKGTGDVELWRTDGTGAGTVRVKDIRAGATGSIPQFLTNVGGTLFMVANDGTTTRAIWKSDGTEAGTVLVSTIAVAEQITTIQSLTAVGNTLYVAGLTNTNTSKLLKSDGTAAGTARVAHFTTQGVPLGTGVAFDGRLYFAVTTTADGRELWTTDGTAAGTVRVTDINPGSGSSSPGSMTVFGGSLYFTANDGQHGIELWKSDGTAAGTTMIADVNPGAVNGASGTPVVLAGPGGGPPRLAFVATDALHGSEVWRSDGTAAGTALVKDVGATPVGSNPTMFTVAGKRVFFNASGGLWVTDGAGGHTQFLRAAPIDAAVDGAGTDTVAWQRGLPTAAAMGDVLFYRSGGRLWRSDGTPAGTYQVSDAPSNVSNLAASGGLVYFSAEEGLAGTELWRSDGTAAGTYRVVDLNPGSAPSGPRNIVALPGGGIVFTSGSLDKLYRSDGTAAGTVPLATARFADAYPATRIGGLVYITMPLGLWVTDGTVAGTRLTVQMSMGQSSAVRQLGGWLYFLAADANRVPGLYRWNGGSGAAELVKTVGASIPSNAQPGFGLTVAGDRLFFAGPSGQTLWVSDGTAAGTKLVQTLPDTNYAIELAAVGSKVYFNAGGLLWVSDGEVAVATFPPPSGFLSGVQGLVSVDEALVFGASNKSYGSEPWVIDAATAVPAAPDGLTVTGRSAGSVGLSWVDHSNGESGFRVERSRTADFATIDASVLLPPNRTSYVDRPLAAGTTYYYRVVAYSRSGDSAATATVGTGTTSGPAAPAAVSAVATSATSVRLNWSDVAGDETGYVVQRSVDPNFDSVQATFDLPSNTATYTDTTVSPLRRYYYRVLATGAVGNSDYATPSGLVVATPDYAPANVQAYGVSSTRIDLKWADVSSTTTSYRVERGVDGGPINQLVTVLSPGYTYFADLNVTGGHTWQYRVTAVTASGPSASAVVSATTTPPVLTTPVKALPPVVDGTATSKPTRVVVSNGVGYFAAKDSELWRTDGTPAGTTRIASMTTVRNLVDVNGVLYFFGRQTVADGFGIFRSDGTAAGTVMVKPASFTTHDLVAYNGKLYFRGLNSNFQGASDSLWVSDGTAAGTVEVQSFGVTSDDAFFRQMVVAGGKLYFGAAQPGTDVTGVYVSDGTTAGTKLLIAAADGGPAQPFNFVAAGNVVYFVATGGFDWMTRVWWRSDGTAQGTVKIANAPIERATLAQGLGNTLYFPGYQPDVDWALFKVGPTDAAASPALPVPAGSPGSSPHAITPFGAGLAFFTTDGSSVTLQLTNAGVTAATPVKTFPAFAGSTVTQAGVFDGRLYFFVREPSGVRALYRSDGTAAGTVALKRYAGFREPGPFAVLGGRLTFAADDGPDGLEPWVTDGTAAGTVLLKDVANTVVPTKPDSMVNFGGAIYFTFTPMGGGRGPIYRTDGTAGGTSLIFDGQASGLFVAGDRVYFTANDPDTGVELWVTDGTAAGTRMVVDLAPGTAGANPLPLAWLGGDKLIFGLGGADALRPTYELWSTDGTAAGTAKIHAPVLVLSVASGYPQAPVVMNGVMYFNGLDADGSLGAQLWRSDGTAAGTYQVRGFTAENASVQPTQFTVMNGALYFYAASATYGGSLWRSDGTAAGTVRLTSVASLNSLGAANGAIYFNGPGGLWRSDGTPGGTALLSPAPTTASRFTAVGDVVYFFSNFSLWRTDGTAAGTAEVRSLSDGAGVNSGSGSQAYLVDVGGTLFYSNGATLWRSDGTFAGTYQVAPLSDGSTAQAQMIATGAIAAPLGDLLLFGMMTADGGRELRTAYVTPPAAPTGLTVSSPAPAPTPAAVPGPPAAAAAPPSGVVLTWADHAVNESGFVIERSGTADFALVTATFFVPANTTTYTDVTASPGDPYFYRVRAVNAAGASAASNGITTAAAKLVSAEFRYDGPAHRLVLRFSDDVGASLTAGDLHLRNLTTGQDVAAGQMTIAYDRATNTATVTFAGGRLADGRYHLGLASGEVLGSNGVALDGDANGSPGGDFGLDFFTLAGDATRDGIVNFDDLLALAKGYNKTGMGFAQGDFTGDGLVNFDDLLVLAKGYNKALPPMSAGATGVTAVAGAAMPSMAAVMAQVDEEAASPEPLAGAPTAVVVQVPAKVKEATKPKVAPVVPSPPPPPVKKPAPVAPKPAPRPVPVAPKPVIVVKKAATIATPTFGTRKIAAPAHR